MGCSAQHGAEPPGRGRAGWHSIQASASTRGLRIAERVRITGCRRNRPSSGLPGALGPGKMSISAVSRQLSRGGVAHVPW
eukprot:5648794-Alexandrium_andersonii.AAC.1